VAGGLLVAGILWLVVSFILGLRQIQADQRVPIPGQGEVTFDESGRYTLFYEGSGTSEDALTLPPFEVSLAPAGGDQEVPIRSEEGSPYSVAGRFRRAIGTVQINQPGSYLLRTEGEPQPVQVYVAVGRGTPGIFRFPLWWVVVLLLVGGSALAVVRMRRRQVRQGPPTPATWGQGALPAGWAADPTRRHELRYWDGQHWTEHVSDRGTQAVDRI